MKHITGSKERRLFIRTRQNQQFRGNPLCQATKQHLTVKTEQENKVHSSTKNR